jgi:flagellar biosynthesis/type III secretory pathway M-ring protein FliF/YscJ
LDTQPDLTDTPTGLLGLMDIPASPDHPPVADCLVLDAVQDSGNLGTLINAGALILVSLLILLLGLRPAMKAILATPAALPGMDAMPSLPSGEGVDGLPGFGGTPFAVADFDMPTPDTRVDDLAREIANTPQARLEKIVELDTDRAAQVLKAWLNGVEAEAA